MKSKLETHRCSRCGALIDVTAPDAIPDMDAWKRHRDWHTQAEGGKCQRIQVEGD